MIRRRTVLLIVATTFIIASLAAYYFLVVSRTAPAEEEEILYLSGVIRTTGLRPEEKEERNIPWEFGNYQLEGTGESYFLLSRDTAVENFTGKCVLITVPESKVTLPANVSSGETAYLFPAITLGEEGRIDVQDFSKCNPYSGEINNPNKQNPRTFTGTVRRETRPAPDIGYDYVINVPEGFKDPTNASGLPDTLFYDAVVVPSSNNIWKDMELNLGQRVTLQGYYVWGFAETKHLLVETITAAK